jgi:MFS family permease
LPTITKGMSFSNTNAQLMTVPPYVTGAISSIFFARLSDRFYWRLPFVAIPLSFTFIGYSIVISVDGDLGGNLGPVFFAIILTCRASTQSNQRVAPGQPKTLHPLRDARSVSPSTLVWATSPELSAATCTWNLRRPSTTPVSASLWLLARPDLSFVLARAFLQVGQFEEGEDDRRRGKGQVH